MEQDIYTRLCKLTMQSDELMENNLSFFLFVSEINRIFADGTEKILKEADRFLYT